MVVTLDTNVLLSATLWDGSVAQKLIFKLILNGIKIFSSREILTEYEKVLLRDFRFTKEEVGTILGKINSFISIVSPKIKVNVVKDDLDDNKILECAVESKSHYVLTYDKHFLNLKEYNGILIIRPEEAKMLFSL